MSIATIDLSRLCLPSLEDIQLSLQQEEYRAYPVKWIESKLGEFIWSKQRDIINSVRDNRRTAVKSCHSAGKSMIASRVVCHFLDTHKVGEAFVVTSAPTFRQVRAILWREISRAHAKGKLIGRLNQTEWWAQTLDGNDEMIAFGIKPDDYDPTSFQGIHADIVLLVLDEACGISKPIWDSSDSLISNDNSRVLAIGNPDDPMSEFAEVCKPGSGWNVIQISAFDTPNFTNEYVPKQIKNRLIGPVWVEEKKRKWGEANPLYISKVTGEFPDIAEDGLIPIRWIRNAQNRDIPVERPVELGVDVGGGTNKSTIALRTGSRVRIIHRDQDPNTMHLLQKVIRKLKETNATLAKVDYIGIGKGIVDRAKEMVENKEMGWEYAKKVIGVNVGRPAYDTEEFANLRAEGCWTLRKRFEEDAIDIDALDEDLASQLCAVKYKHVAGRIQIESKADMKRRGLESPDDFDAVMLAFLKETKPKKKLRGTLGLKINSRMTYNRG